MPSSKRRNRSIIRSDTGQMIDRKSKQLLFFECDVETVKRVNLKSYDEFTQEGAKHVFDKYQSKRQSKSTLYCLTDRIRFQRRGSVGSNPFRKHLTYRDIRHFFVFPENPRIFMLCVCDENAKKSYELYRCKPEDVNTICDLTYGASTDPQNIIRDTNAINRGSLSSREDASTPLTPKDAVYENCHLEATPVKSNGKIGLLPSDDESDDDSIRSTDVFSNMVNTPTPYVKPGVRSFSETPETTHGRPKRADVSGVYTCYEDIKEPPTKPIRLNIEPYPKTTNHHQVNRVPVIKTASSEMSISQTKFSPPKMNRLIPVKSSMEVNSHLTDTRITRDSRNYAGRITIIRDYPQVKRSTSQQKFHSTLDLRHGDEITFISCDLRHGTHVSDDGPVYMYITRYESQTDVRVDRPEKSTNRFRHLPAFPENGE